MISRDDVATWAAAGESETLEFKRSTGQRREAAQTLCAMLNRRGGRVLFGVEPAAGWSVADLDEEEVRRTLEEGIRIGRVGEPGTREPESILRGLGLMKRDVLLRAAVVLFGRADRLLPDFTQCLLRVARFRGTEKGEFLDNRQFHGHAFDLFQRAQRFLLDHMPIAGHFEPGRMERVDEPAYPPLAFREAIANAICHRDYASGGSSIGVAMYDDRLEVTSSGTLHFGFTPQALFEPHESRPWNPLIASVFYRRGIIETWGQGTLKMAAWSEEAGLPKPEILEIPGAVVVRFRGKKPGKALGKTPGKTPAAILELLKEEPDLSIPEMAVRLQKSETAVERAIRRLRELGRLERVGPAKGGSWKVLE